MSDEKYASGKLTLDDIAASLGLSKSTVSRAISGKGRISPETTARVRRYIVESGYKPNAMAKSLAKQKTYNIGVVCPIDYEIFDLKYFHSCLQGISASICSHGYDIVLPMIGIRDITNLKRLIENRKVDGIILTRTMFDDMAAAYLKQSGVPFVVIGSSPDKDLVQVDNDHLTACCELTSVLIAKGFRKIAIVGGDDTHIVTDTRRRGFELAFERAGLPVDRDLVYMGVSGSSHVRKVLMDVTQKKADCLICMDEKLTGITLNECRALHIRIPEDLRIASYYDSAFLSSMSPPITALDIDDRKLGEAAGQAILALIRGEHPTGVLLRNYQLILRESTM